jgi:hypothetical protein
VCECGHTGFLKCRENDAPFSAPWEEYSLEGFEGGMAGLDFKRTAQQLLASLNPKCPKCGQSGKLRYA